jgi:lipase chaperone LimK
MHPPLLLCLKDSREIMLFNTASALESHIEAIDVINDEYLAYDSSGLELELSVNAHGATTVGRSPEHRPDRLRSIILSYYESNPFFSEERTLAELNAELKQIYRFRHDVTTSNIERGG